MREARVALVGPRAAGKSTVGEALARRLDVPFRDSDAALAAKVGEPAGSFLAAHGEAVFRAVEAEVAGALLTGPGPAVLALGGGAVTIGSLRRALRDEGWLVVHLDADPAVLSERQAAAAGRPPLTRLPLEDEVAAVRAARGAWYREVRDLVIDTGERRVDACVDVILAVV